MANLTMEQLDALMGKGKINSSTYDMAKSKLSTPQPTEQIRDPASVQPAPIPEPVTQLPPVSVQAPEVDPLTRLQVKNQIDMGQATAMQKGALGIQAQAARELGKATEEAYDTTQKQLADMEAKRALAEKERQDKLIQAETDYKNATQQAADFKIDNNRFYSSLNTAQKIGLGIASILAGFAGGENRVVAMIENETNKDIEAQKNDYLRMQDKGKAAQNVYAQMKERFQDDKLAELAARGAILERMKMTLEKEAAKYTSKETQAKVALSMGVLDEAKAKQQQEWVKEYTQRQALLDLQGLGTGQSASDESRMIDRRLSLQPPEVREKMMARRLTGKGFDFIANRGSDQVVKEVGDMARDSEAAIDMVNELKSLDAKAFKDMPLSEKRNRAKVLQTVLIGMLNRPLTGGGAMSESDKQIVRDAASNPAQYLNITAVDKLNQLESVLKNRMKNAIQSVGGTYRGDVGFEPTRVK